MYFSSASPICIFDTKRNDTFIFFPTVNNIDKYWVDGCIIIFNILGSRKFLVYNEYDAMGCLNFCVFVFQLT